MTPNYNKTYDAAVARSERLAYKELSSIYNDIKRVVIYQSPEQAIGLLDNIQAETFKQLAAKIYSSEGATFYLWQQKELSKKKDFIRDDFKVGFFSEIWRAIMGEILSNSLLLIRFSKMAEKTRNDIRKILIAGTSANRSKVDIGRMITGEIGYVKNRALRIARTETTYAASLGSYRAAKDSTLPLVKVWTHGGGGKDPRPHHVALTGTTVGKEAYFSVNGQDMLFAGDPNGGAAETINCTCNVTFIVDESKLI